MQSVCHALTFDSASCAPDTATSPSCPWQTLWPEQCTVFAEIDTSCDVKWSEVHYAASRVCENWHILKIQMLKIRMQFFLWRHTSTSALSYLHRAESKQKLHFFPEKVASLNLALHTGLTICAILFFLGTLWHKHDVHTCTYTETSVWSERLNQHGYIIAL